MKSFDGPVCPQPLLLSIKPEYSRKIFAGEKGVELRRTRPKLRGSRLTFVYSSSPRKAIVGGFSIKEVLEAEPEVIWSEVGSTSGISRQAFSDYFHGCETAVALVIEDVFRFADAIELGELRAQWPGFHPPQSYRFISPDMKLTGEVLKKLRVVAEVLRESPQLSH